MPGPGPQDVAALHRIGECPVVIHRSGGTQILGYPWVLDHGLIINWQKLFANHFGNRMKPGAGTSSKDNTLEA